MLLVQDFCSWEDGSPCRVIPGLNSYGTWEVRRASDVGFADHTIKDLTAAAPPKAAFEVERAGFFEELPRDHTTHSEDGYYLLFKSPGTKNMTSLTLLGPENYRCMSFWYYMPDLSNGVELYVQDQQILSSNGTWKHYQLRLQSVRDDPIVAVSGLNLKGFVAIDDVFLSEEACGVMTRAVEITYCGNETIFAEHVCDFVPDCDDGADERDCGQCDFSESSCGWYNNSGLNIGPTSWGRYAIGSVENSPQTGADGRRH
ncbi:hypothetical protein MTO96_044319, partial [Rhipicephalus appendiculatus]